MTVYAKINRKKNNNIYDMFGFSAIVISNNIQTFICKQQLKENILLFPVKFKL